MKDILYYILFFSLFLSCKNDPASINLVSSDQKDSSLELLPKAEFNLIDYPKSYLDEEGLEDWEDFEKLYESMNQLTELNFDDINVDLLAISSRLNGIIKKDLPGSLETPQIRSRLKVVQIQLDKSRYFTQHYREDSLYVSVELLYKHYNSFILRILSLKSESKVIMLEANK